MCLPCFVKPPVLSLTWCGCSSGAMQVMKCICIHINLFFRGWGHLPPACPEQCSLRPSSLPIACSRLHLPILPRFLFLRCLRLLWGRYLHANLHSRWPFCSRPESSGSVCRSNQDLLDSTWISFGPRVNSCCSYSLVQSPCSYCCCLPCLPVGHVQVGQWTFKF